MNKQFEPILNEYILIANILLFLCYIQSNLLMFRLMFISACLFLILNSLNTPVISIDNVIFCILFTMINVYLAIPLIKKIIPPNFSKEQKEMYQNHFNGYLLPIDLKKLFDISRRKIYRVSTKIIRSGNEFSSLFFIAKKGSKCEIKLQMQRKKYDLSENSWVGIMEYMNLIATKNSLSKAVKEFNTGEWGVNLKVKIENQYEFENENEYEYDKNFIGDDKTIYQNNDQEDYTVIVYEFELKKLSELFNDKAFGQPISRGLQSIWLNYCSDIVKRVDRNKESSKEVTMISGKFERRGSTVLSNSNYSVNQFKSTLNILEKIEE